MIRSLEIGRDYFVSRFNLFDGYRSLEKSKYNDFISKAKRARGSVDGMDNTLCGDQNC
jgi:hypothetical protein